jgi:hypothetical protein
MGLGAVYAKGNTKRLMEIQISRATTEGPLITNEDDDAVQESQLAF